MADADVTRIAHGVHRVADGLVNWYVVEDGGAVTLVDTGWPRSLPVVEQALAGLGHSLGDVVAAVITHGHPDHSGTAEALRRDHGVTVHAHVDEVGHLTGEAAGSSPFRLVPGLVPHLWRPTATGFVLHAAARGFLMPARLREVAGATDGAVIDAPGRLRLVHTPGHTAGHATYVLDDAGVAFTGDALVTLDPLTRRRGPQLMPEVFQADSQQARRSLDRLAALGDVRMLPGHGDPSDEPLATAVDRALTSA